MKYIRTEDGIQTLYIDEFTEYGKEYYKNCKIADTIEELCDEFVYTGSKFSPYFKIKGYGSWDGTRIESDKDMHKELQSKGCVFYGAIWTDKGLIYVAKMNNKGELELI